MSVEATAQPVAPPGYTGAINTPTALTQPRGTLSAALTNSIPEWRRRNPEVGAFGGFNLGFGLADHVEAVGRLTFDGDLQCDAYRSGCRASARDLSVSAKWRLPLHWVLPSHEFIKPDLAVGYTDFGGAATNFRQQYVVGSLSVGPAVVSAGWSAATAGGLIDGKFGSLIWNFDGGLTALAESDSREYRAGVAWRRRLSDNIDVNLALSRKFTDRTDQRSTQSTLAFTYHFGRGDRESARRPFELPESPRPRLEAFASANPQSSSTAVDDAPAPGVDRVGVSPAAPMTAGTQSLPGLLREPSRSVAVESIDELAVANRLAETFAEAGFSDIDVARTDAGWMVRAEPRLWRQNRLDAYGAAVAAFAAAARRMDLSEAHALLVSLTFMGQPTGALSVAGPFSVVQCLEQYLVGSDECAGLRAVQLHYSERGLPGLAGIRWLVLDAHDRRFMPQFEFSPAASYTAGTEFGLFDYSLGVTLGWEIPLARGLFWQGFFAKLLSESEDFANPRSYFRRVGLGEATRPGANLLVYQRPIWGRAWAQLALGNLGHRTSGGQVNAYWASDDGKYRLTWIRGQWRHPSTAYLRQSNLFNFGWRPLSPDFQLTYTVGKFHNNDEGHRIAASYFFADHAIQLYWRRTGPSEFLPNRNAYIGFGVTMPLGPKKAYELGPATFRFRDRWDVGLETKVGQRDNYIEPFYGSFPGIRHSLDTDIFDFNRNDLALAELNAARIRVTAREVFRDLIRPASIPLARSQGIHF